MARQDGTTLSLFFFKEINKDMKTVLIGCVLFLIIHSVAPTFAEEIGSHVVTNLIRIGAGTGIYYGGYGVNTEYHINKFSSISAGLGYVTHEVPGWAVGASLYPLKNDKIFNPRLSGYFGRVSTIKWSDNSYEARNGGTLGGGFEWRVYKMLSLDFDLFYIFKEKRADVGYGSDVGASAGVGVVF